MSTTHIPSQMQWDGQDFASRANTRVSTPVTDGPDLESLHTSILERFCKEGLKETKVSFLGSRYSMCSTPDFCHCSAVSMVKREELKDAYLLDIKNIYPIETTPLSIVFHCSGKLGYELYIVDELVEIGYSHLDLHFVDSEYTQERRAPRSLAPPLAPPRCEYFSSHIINQEKSRDQRLRHISQHLPSTVLQQSGSLKRAPQLVTAYSCFSKAARDLQFSHLLQNARRKTAHMEKRSQRPKISTHFHTSLREVPDTLVNPSYIILDPAGHEISKNLAAVYELQDKMAKSAHLKPISYALYKGTTHQETLVKLSSL